MFTGLMIMCLYFFHKEDYCVWNGKYVGDLKKNVHVYLFVTMCSWFLVIYTEIHEMTHPVINAVGPYYTVWNFREFSVNIL